MSQYVDIDLHRRRSQVVILDEERAKLSSVKVENSPLALAAAVAEAGHPRPRSTRRHTRLTQRGFVMCGQPSEQGAVRVVPQTPLFDQRYSLD